MKLSAILAPLLAAKVDPEVILDAVRAWEAEHEASEEQGKEKARARWRKWKAGQTAANADQRLQTTEAVGKQLVRERARGEDNLLPKKITGQEELVLFIKQRWLIIRTCLAIRFTLVVRRLLLNQQRTISLQNANYQTMSFMPMHLHLQQI